MKKMKKKKKNKMIYCKINKDIKENKLEMKYGYHIIPNDNDDCGWRFFQEKVSVNDINNDQMEICDLKELLELDKSLPNDLKYKPYNIAYEKINGKWVLVNEDNTPEKERVYFKNIKNKKTVHFECTIGQFVLPWNKETIQCYCDTNSPVPQYYPVVPEPFHYTSGVYLPDICSERGYFTKNELKDYYQRCEEKYQENKKKLEIEKNEMKNVYDKILSLHPDIIPLITYENYFIECRHYEIVYNKGKYEILKFKNDDLTLRFYWNVDTTFEKITSTDMDDIVKQYYNIIKAEYYEK